jgi:hypothetical protein
MTADTTHVPAPVPVCGCADATGSPSVAGPAVPLAATPCCGTPQAAASAGACCEPAARAEAVAAGASCC